MSSVAGHGDVLSIEDYLRGEAEGEIRHEFIDGQLYAMTGSSDRHGLIAKALGFALTPAAGREGCQLFTPAMKVRLEMGREALFCYPCLLLVCDRTDRESYFRRSPCLGTQERDENS